MVDITELIERARTTNLEEPAVQALVAAGPEALARILVAVNADSGRYLPGLYEVIRRSTYPEAVPILIAHSESGSAAAVRSVFHALGTGHDDNALAFVVERLTDAAELATTRAAAAEALHGSRRPAAAAALRTVVAERRGAPSDQDWLPSLLVNAVTALATMDDHSGADALYRLFHSEHETARALAVRAFRVVLDDKTFTHLAVAAEDPSVEVRRAVIDPLFLLGAPASAELLLRLASDDDDDEVVNNSMIRFGDITGLDLSGVEDLPFARERWHEVHSGLDPEVCHRFGVPITLDSLLEEFVDKERQRTSLAEELRCITGIDVPSPHLASGVVSAQEAVGGVSFTAGRVHRWGHPQPMPTMPAVSSP